MKKSIGTYFTRYFKMPHVYRDDLEAIERVILEDLKPKRYSLDTDGGQYEELAQVPAGLSFTNVLVIHTHSPCLRLKFARSWTELYAGDEDSNVDEAIHHIALIVGRGERRWLWAFCKYSAWLAPLLGFGSFAIVLGLIGLGYLLPHALYLACWFLFMAAVWWGIGHRYSLNSFSAVDFKKVRGRSSWWDRHRETLFGLLCGIGVGFVSAWLFTSYLRIF